jgi:hypothetical protein
MSGRRSKNVEVWNMNSAVREVDFGSSMCYTGFWTGTKILRSNYKRLLGLKKVKSHLMRSKNVFPE